MDVFGCYEPTYGGLIKRCGLITGLKWSLVTASRHAACCFAASAPRLTSACCYFGRPQRLMRCQVTCSSAICKRWWIRSTVANKVCTQHRPPI